MQDTGRLAGGANLRRATRAIRDNPHEMLAAALRSDEDVREFRDAKALRRLRRDLTALRAGPGGPDSADGEARNREGAAFANPWAAMAGRDERPILQDVLIRLQPLVLLAAAFAATAALLMLLGASGPALVAAIDIGSAHAILPGAE